MKYRYDDLYENIHETVLKQRECFRDTYPKKKYKYIYIWFSNISKIRQIIM